MGLARPKFGALAVSGHNLVLSGTGGAPARSYLVLNSTSASLSTPNWSCLATNLFDDIGSFVFTNPLATAPAQRFFRLQMP